ncbi:MAG TPA: type II toxin-antitoxin system HicB family antitoxin [bacterium]|nr:type II toxin-antitoxin system HicB family antitoxin [bacterium]
MEKIINLQIEKLPEGFYLATSPDVQGLVAQGRTISETMEIARDVVRRLLEARGENNAKISLQEIDQEFTMPLIIGIE